MGKARQAAEAVTTALENEDYDEARSWLADDFTFVDPYSPNPPMNADQWMAANHALRVAFPDFSFNFEIIREEGSHAWVRSRMTGTHNGTLDLSRMGMGTIPATGRHVSTGTSVSRGTVNNAGRVERIEVVEQADDAGIVAVLKQVGATIS